MTYQLHLYIAGMTPIADRAIANVRRICEACVPDRYELKVIDLNVEPDKAEAEQIVAIPTLLRKRPEPQRKIIGDMSDTQKVINGLQLQQ